MLYKVGYAMVALMPDGSSGNISQGYDVAYIDCELSDVEQRLIDDLSTQKRYPIISLIKAVDGHIINR